MAHIRQHPRHVFSLLCLLIMFASVSGYALEHFRFPSIAETFPDGELVIGIDASYPPFGTIVDDAFAGLDIDLGRMLAAELGLSPRFVMVNFDSTYDAVTTGTVHVTLAALRVDPVRTADFVYTWGYLNDGIMLLSPDGLADGWLLGGRRVGVALGTEAHAETRKWSRRVRDMQIMTFDTPAEALYAMTEQQTVDAVMVDAVSARFYGREHPRSVYSGIYLTDAFYAGAVRIDRKGVIYHLNGAMLTLLNNGQIEALLARHLGSEPPLTHGK